MTLIELIRKYRETHDISQRQFAAQCGLSNGYISMLERGENPKTGQPIMPTIQALQKLAAGMNMSLTAFLSSIDDMPVDLGDIKITADVYSEHFRKRLSEQLDCIDPQQFGGDPAPLSDYHRLQQLADGSTPLSLKDACEAAEALGCSMSYMLQEIDEDFVRDTKKAPGTDSSEPRDAIEFDIISRIQKMDPAQQSLLLATLKIADEQNQKTPVAAPASIDDTKQ